MEHAATAWKRCLVQRGASMWTRARLCKPKTKLIQVFAAAWTVCGNAPAAKASAGPMPTRMIASRAVFTGSRPCAAFTRAVASIIGLGAVAAATSSFCSRSIGGRCRLLHPPPGLQRVVDGERGAGPGQPGGPWLCRLRPERIVRRQAERQERGRTQIEAAGRDVALADARLMSGQADAQPAVRVERAGRRRACGSARPTARPGPGPGRRPRAARAGARSAPGAGRRRRDTRSTGRSPGTCRPAR